MPSLRPRLGTAALAAPATLVLALMVALPLLALILFSFLEDIGDVSGLTLDNYSQLFESDLYFRLFIKSLWTAGLSTLIATAIAWPAAWCLSRAGGKQKALLLGLVIVPFLTSYLLLTYSMFVLLAQGGPLMSPLDTLGITGPDSSILFSQVATVVMMSYEGLPIMFLVMYSAAERIDDSLLAAAQSLGAGRWQTFRRVILPLSMSTLLAGFVLTFMPLAGAFVEPQVLGGPSGQLIGNVINDQLTLVNNGPFGAALSLILLVAILVLVAIAFSIRNFFVPKLRSSRRHSPASAEIRAAAASEAAS